MSSMGPPCYLTVLYLVSMQYKAFSAVTPRSGTLCCGRLAWQSNDSLIQKELQQLGVGQGHML